MADKQKTQVLWKYIAMSHTAILVLTNDREVEFRLTDLVRDMTNTQELMFFYGFKQWIASGFAKDPYAGTDAEKKDRATEMYRELKEYGLFLTENGTKMKVASPENLEGKSKKARPSATDVKNMAVIQRKVLKGIATDEEITWLLAMLDKYDPNGADTETVETVETSEIN